MTTDHAAWANAARETSAAFGAWSKRIETTPGPLADAARELAKSAQLRRYSSQAPKAGTATARGATMLLLAATSKSDRAAYALMFRQLALTAKAIHDMHQATNDLQRVRRLTSTMAEVTRAVEASAANQTIKPQPVTLEELRSRHPGLDEETLRARFVAGRGREGTPLPSKLTRAVTSTATTGPARTPQRTRNQPDIER